MGRPRSPGETGFFPTRSPMSRLIDRSAPGDRLPQQHLDVRHWGPMSQATFTVFGFEIERAAWLRGATVSAGIALVLGVGVGSFVDEGSNLSLVLAALIGLGFIGGGVVAGMSSSANHYVHGTLTAVPVMVLATAVQAVRRVTGDGGEPWIGLVFMIFLFSSLGTLGGVIGARFSTARRSLLQR